MIKLLLYSIYGAVCISAFVFYFLIWPCFRIYCNYLRSKREKNKQFSKIEAIPGVVLISPPSLVLSVLSEVHRDPETERVRILDDEYLQAFCEDH